MTPSKGLVHSIVGDQAVYLGLCLVVSFAVAARLFYLLPFTTEEQTRRIFFRPWCRVLGHQWADEYRYGVENVCLHCCKRREVIES